MSYESWRISFQSSEQAARAAYNMFESVRKDAERWRHARKLLTVDDIEGSQGAFDSFGGLVSEEECLRADAAIDTAMTGGNARHKPTREAGSA